MLEKLKLLKEKVDESMYGTFANGGEDAPVDERLMRRIKMMNWIFFILACIVAIFYIYWLFAHYAKEHVGANSRTEEYSHFGSLERNGAASSRNEEYSNFERNGAAGSSNEEYSSLKRNGAAGSSNEEYSSLKRNGAAGSRNEEYSHFGSLKRNGAASSRNEEYSN